METFDTELYEAVSRLSDVLAKYGERVREIVVTPHMRAPMTLETSAGPVLVLFGDDRAGPMQRALHAYAGMHQALADAAADRIIKKIEAKVERGEANYWDTFGGDGTVKREGG